MKIYQEIDYEFFNNKVVKCTICAEVVFDNQPPMFLTSVGKAVCVEPDVYDEVKGKRIAESKALISLHKRIKECIIERYLEVEDYYLEVFSCLDKEQKRIERDTDYLNQLRESCK